MKLLRLLLIAVFMLAAFATSAQADGTVVGFVPLVSNPDPDIPVMIQSQRVLELLLPDLLEARSAGQLLEFQPNLAGGVLRLVYRPYFNTAAVLLGRPVFAELDQAMAAVAAPRSSALKVAGDVSITAGSAFFQLSLNNGYVQATGLTPGALVLGTIRNKSGRLLGVMQTNSDGLGDLTGFFNGVGGFTNFYPGAVVKFREYSGVVLLNTYQVVVPKIEFSGLNKATGVVTGKTLPNRNFTAQWWHDKWDAAETTVTAVKLGKSNSLGVWRADFGNVVLHGGDDLYIKLQVNSNFSFDTRMTIPFIQCQVGGNLCLLFTFPGKQSTLTILNKGITYKFEEQTFLRGIVFGQLLSPAGQPIALVPGARITGTGASPLNLPNFTASIDYSTDMVSGHVWPNKWFNATLFDAYSLTSFQGYLHSDSTGSFSQDLSILVDLVPTNAYWGQLSVVNPSTGNSVTFSKAFSP